MDKMAKRKNAKECKRKDYSEKVSVSGAVTPSIRVMVQYKIKCLTNINPNNQSFDRYIQVIVIRSD